MHRPTAKNPPPSLWPLARVPPRLIKKNVGDLNGLEQWYHNVIYIYDIYDIYG